MRMNFLPIVTNIDYRQPTEKNMETESDTHQKSNILHSNSSYFVQNLVKFFDESDAIAHRISMIENFHLGLNAPLI